jgi:hypothetical protein
VHTGDGKYADRTIAGVKIVLADRDRYHACLPCAAVLWALGRTSANSLAVRPRAFDERIGRLAMRAALLRGEAPGDDCTG